MKKTCFKCGKTLPLDMFYKHPEMKDGHLGKCKLCNREDTKKRIEMLKKTDPIWAAKERERQCAKYLKASLAFPEKTAAHYAIHNMPRTPGCHLHHWSYRAEHRKDVIDLMGHDHLRIHTMMVYDKERFQYRRLDGVLLNTRAAAQRYYDYVLSLEDGAYPSNPPF